MIGQTISHYRIQDELGRGGMGVVYRARDEKLQRTVALKVLAPRLLSDPSQRRRFLQEARSTAAVSHPYVANLHEVGEEDGTLFLVMEYVEGQTLRACIDENRLSREDRLRIALEIAEGMASAHDRGVIHRDLKPENVMITPDDHPKILDFGLAKLHTKPAPVADDDATIAGTIADITLQGQIVGTPAYMAPEQARGEEVDHRADIFASGVMFYELITGASPFRGRTPIDTLSSVLHKSPPRPSELAPDSSRPMDRVILKCIEKDPADRYASAADLAADLREASRATAPRFTLPRMSRRTLSIALGLVAMAAVSLWLSRIGGGPPALLDTGTGTPNWIVVAQLEGLPDQPDVLVAARELLVASLQQSDLVIPLSRAQIRRGLQMAGMPADTVLAPDVARQLAFRASARTYVEGRIDRIGSSFNLVFHVADAESGNLLTSVTGLAANESELIPRLDDLGRQLRRRLGENPEALARTRQLLELYTDSFDAYRLFTDAMGQADARDFRGSVQTLNRAVQLDPDFAVAWYSLGIFYRNLGHADSSQVSLERALALPDRLGENQQLMAQAIFTYSVGWKLEEGLALYDRLIALQPFGFDHHNNRATILFNLGRYEEAVVALDQAIGSRPFGPSTLHLYNKQRTLMQVGRFDEAAALNQDLSGIPQSMTELNLALARDPDEATRVAALHLNSGSQDLQFTARMGLASIAASRGDLARAARGIVEARETAPAPFFEDVADMAAVQLWLMADGALPPPVLPTSPSTVPELVVAGIAAAAGGDAAAAAARRADIDAADEATRRRYATDIQLLDAWLAAARGDWAGVGQTLGQSATRGPGPWFTGRMPLRWLQAWALAHLDDPTATLAAYRQVLDPTRMHHDTWSWWRLALGFSQLEAADLLISDQRWDEARPLLDEAAGHLESAHPSWAQRVRALEARMVN